MKNTIVYEEQQIVRRAYEALKYLYEKGQASLEHMLSKDCHEIGRISAKYRLNKRLLIDVTLFSEYGFTETMNNPLLWERKMIGDYYIQISPFHFDWKITLIRKLWFKNKVIKYITARTVEELEEGFRQLGFYVEQNNQV